MIVQFDTENELIHLQTELRFYYRRIELRRTQLEIAQNELLRKEYTEDILYYQNMIYHLWKDVSHIL